MENNLIEEFDRIKNNIIYMDWNTISYLRNSDVINTEKLKSEVLCLCHILFNLIDVNYFVIPYSNAHLLDIKTGSKEYEELSLNFLKAISNGWQVSEDYQNREMLRLDKIQNIFDDYEQYINHLNKTDNYAKKLNIIMNPLFDLVKNYIEFTTNVHDVPDEIKNEVDDLITCLFPTSEDLKIKLLKKNKKYKFDLKDLNGKKIKFPFYDSVKSKFPNKNVKELVDLCIKKSDLPFSSLQELTDKFEIIKDTPALSSFNNKINKLYFLAEFISVSTEKLESKTAFQGVLNDQFHLNYGLRCNYFITEDDALYNKGIFIRDWLNTRTKIFKIDEFNQFLLKSYSRQTRDTKGLTQNEFIYTFNDKNGNFLKEYKVNIKD